MKELKGATSFLPVILLVVGLIVGSGGAYFFVTNTYKPIIDEYENKIETFSTQITTLQTDNSNLQNEIIVYSSELSDAESEIADHKAQLIQLDLDLREAETVIDDYESDLSILESQVSSLESQISSLQTQLSSKSSSLTSVQSDLNELESQLENIKEIVVTQHYDWYFDYGGYDKWYWDFPMTLETYFEYYFKPRYSDWEDWTEMITDPNDDFYIEDIVKGLNSMAIEYDMREIDKVNFVISFVQNLPYTEDDVTTGWDEYPRYPIETLFNRGGDCEDTSILVASILDEMGYNVCLLILENENHCAVGIDIPSVYGSYYTYDGKKYYYLETTGDGWTIGEIPPDFEDTTAYIYPINP